MSKLYKKSVSPLNPSQNACSIQVAAVMTFAMAQQECNKYGANLPRILDQFEQTEFMKVKVTFIIFTNTCNGL